MDDEIKKVFRSNFEKIGLLLILCILIYFPLFSFLGTLPIRIWDESRLAINAIEMLHSGDPLVTTFDGKPDNWNSKPPLMIWLQVLSLKIFGINEFAIRFPSALAALLTCLVLFLFLKKTTGLYLMPAIVILVLTTSMGYISIHGTRTGDFDALLCFNVTAYSLCLIYYVFTDNVRYYFFFFFFLILAILSKSIAGLMLLPGLTLALIIDKKFVNLLKSPVTYIGSLSVILIIGLYYGLREYYSPGYVISVIGNEITGRYLEDLEGHKEPFLFYFNKLIEYRFAGFLMMLTAGLLLNQFLHNRILARISNYATIISITFLLIISSGTSKMEHYDLPLYPLFATVTGIFIYNIYKALSNQQYKILSIKYNLLPVVLLFAIFFTPYQQVIKKCVKPKEVGYDDYFYSLSHLLKKIGKSDLTFDQISIYYDGYRAHIDFYQHVLATKGIASKYTSLDSVNENEIIAVGDENQLKEIGAEYKYKILVSEKFARLVKIIKPKNYRDLVLKSKSVLLDSLCYSKCTPWKMELLSMNNSNETAVSAFSDFETNYDCDDFRQHIVTAKSYSGNRSVYINSDHKYSASFKCSLSKLMQYDQMEITGKMYLENNKSNVVLVMDKHQNGENIHSQSTQLKYDSDVSGEWLDFTVHMTINKPGKSNAELILYFLNPMSGTIYFDDLRITFM